jgi:hypothetical protein
LVIALNRKVDLLRNVAKSFVVTLHGPAGSDPSP